MHAHIFCTYIFKNTQKRVRNHLPVIDDHGHVKTFLGLTKIYISQNGRKMTVVSMF